MRLNMAPMPLDLSPNYVAVAGGIRALHRLALLGQEDSAAADAIRDATDAAWEALSEAERNRARGLSEDLYSISEPRTNGHKTLAPDGRSPAQDVVEAQRRGDWDLALELLRKTAQDLSPGEVSYLRGSIWQAAGDHDTAAL